MKTLLLAVWSLMLCTGLLCTGEDLTLLAPRASALESTEGLTLVARIVHISDTHIIDEESPARFIGAQVITRSAWRPWEAWSTQLLDGILRTTNNVHASGRPIDFLISTGDGCDNAQTNELNWMLGIFDGLEINPRSGPDDRDPASRPSLELDPHAPFAAQGLYRAGVHGDDASIPWYTVFGNHDSYAIGVLPILESVSGERVAPLPFPRRPGILLPAVFRPTGSWANGSVTPAFTGPPTIGQLAVYVEPSADRAYFNRREYIQAMFTTLTGPPGHGFAHPAAKSWYATTPLPGIRLIGLDTTDHPRQDPGQLYVEGGISERQKAFLVSELEVAQANDELVIVASHHPSEALIPSFGSVLLPDPFRELLRSYPNVILHLAGHRHRNLVVDHGSYLEIETCSTLDWPQEARLIEIYRDDATGEIVISYDMFSHTDDRWPALEADDLREMRLAAQSLARDDVKIGLSFRHNHESPPAAAPGSAADRDGSVHLPAR